MPAPSYLSTVLLFYLPCPPLATSLRRVHCTGMHAHDHPLAVRPPLSPSLSPFLPTCPLPVFTEKNAPPRRLNDLTNSSGTKLNNHLNSSSGSTPSRNRNTKKAARLGTPPTRAHGGSDDAGVIDVVFGGGEEGGRRAKASLRRVSSRTGATPQRVPVAGRTRSRLSMAPTCPLRNLR